MCRDRRGQVELDHGFPFTWSGRGMRANSIIAIGIKAVEGRKETRDVREERQDRLTTRPHLTHLLACPLVRT